GTVGAAYGTTATANAALAEALSGAGSMAPGTRAALAVGALLLGGVGLAHLGAGPLGAGGPAPRRAGPPGRAGPAARRAAARAAWGGDGRAGRLLRALELRGRVEVAVLACHAAAAAATFGGLLSLGELGPGPALFGALCCVLLSSVALFPPRLGLESRVEAAL